MLGALTFLPTFMQFVDGVSATTSGLRTLPMVAGLLLTSISSGTLVGRTGRYKVFPVAGTLIMAVGFVLLSRMDPSTSALVQSLRCSSSAPASACVCRCWCSSCRTPPFRRPRRRHVGGDVLSHHRQLVRGRRLSARCSPTSCAVGSARPWPQAVPRRAAHDPRGAASGCRTRSRRRSSRLRRIAHPGVLVRCAGRAGRFRPGAVARGGAAARHRKPSALTWARVSRCRPAKRPTTCWRSRSAA